MKFRPQNCVKPTNQSFFYETPIGFLVRRGMKHMYPPPTMAKLAQTATGARVKPWRPFSGDGAPLSDGAPYEFVRTIYFRVVTPLIAS